MLLIILTLIVFQMRSLSKTVLVILTFPLGLIGANLSLWLTAQPFGFLALRGILAPGGGPPPGRSPRGVTVLAARPY